MKRWKIRLAANGVDSYVECDGERRMDVVSVAVYGGVYEVPRVELTLNAESVDLEVDTDE